MRLLSKVISLFLLFLIVLVLFLPKEQLFIKFVNQLYKEHIYLKDYKYSDELFTSNISNMTINYDGINIAKISNSRFDMFLVYNNIDINNISLDESLNAFVPSNIKNININYSILDPLYVNASVLSKLYSIKIQFDIVNLKLNAKFKTSKFFRKKYKKLLRELNYDKTIKDYTYEHKL